MAVNDRELILDSLIEINERNRYSHIVEKEVLDKHNYLPQERKAFIKRTVEGTIEKQLLIDETINKFSRVKVNKLKPLIRELLRMSVYQLLYMDKVPVSAVINEAVKLSGKRGFSTLKGFVNGVLRSIDRNKEELDIDTWAVPNWLYEHLRNSYGEAKAELILQDIAKEHPVVIRERRCGWANSLEEGLVAKLDYAGIKGAYILKKGVSVSQLSGYENGDFVIQDIASMQPVFQAGIKPGDLVIDVCAAPGGKSIQAYDLGARVIACDISEYKVGLIKDNALRCGINENDTSFENRIWDATKLDEANIEKADVVIADLPCSGLGVMGRKADIIHKTKPEDLESLSILQKNILDVVWKYVKPGGVLMYSTCTMNPGENENMSRYVTANYPFELEYERQFLPGIDPTDGFYLARLVRKR